MPSPLVALLSLAMATSVPSVSRPARPGGPVALADSVVIEKRAHRLTLYHLGVPMQLRQQLAVTERHAHLGHRAERLRGGS